MKALISVIVILVMVLSVDVNAETELKYPNEEIEFIRAVPLEELRDVIKDCPALMKILEERRVTPKAPYIDPEEEPNVALA